MRRRWQGLRPHNTPWKSHVTSCHRKAPELIMSVTLHAVGMRRLLAAVFPLRPDHKVARPPGEAMSQLSKCPHANPSCPASYLNSNFFNHRLHIASATPASRSNDTAPLRHCWPTRAAQEDAPCRFSIMRSRHWISMSTVGRSLASAAQHLHAPCAGSSSGSSNDGAVRKGGHPALHANLLAVSALITMTSSTALAVRHSVANTKGP